MQKILVIGNGESRKDIDVNSLEHTKIGCNAILRDFSVNHLICVDKHMLLEALESNYNKHATVYTRANQYALSRYQTNIQIVPDLPYVGDQRPDDPIHWGAGPYAVLLAAKLAQGATVHVLGFDLYSTSKHVNNVYKGTDNYVQADKHAVDPRYWIYQIGKLFKHYATTQFVVHQTDNWQLPKAWNKPNISLDTISNL
jgi:hypothetical protein|tara:strand:- start:21 stop:614 length:594 start_codon:yes stop_codon:yes gene_type:complete